MDVSWLVLIVVSVAAVVIGIFLGWTLGVAHQKRQDTNDAFRQAALRANASFDFAAIRGKAEHIVGLANDIATAARKAQETVHKEFGHHVPHPGEPNPPSDFRP